ncbi:MAG: 5'/3'-nucleotidase SurE [Treponema sp.]|uniref:5'-nucleotidase SurE n=1 Tax=Treponema rectale TaxID=744512 RepID=A0A840SEY2_9SPIR|nr:5'/3'-nucleotidase SurE [Treponema rectale]MBB5218486.1 5'-nucleotidase [Treponema rectale]MBO6176434.1 5'/3'-nucleotidase SurE [Treponema sp.]QOS39828.1 5'/3'-nucleotidase SurE [Treponema rectale]
MKILLTNDDGFGAPGLEKLYEVLSPLHDVTVVAPSSNRSGYSARITMERSMELISYGNDRYALDGSPVDCVIAAFRGLMKDCLPDLVISGINSGYNLGTDIMYSGTCGAARQSAVNGIPGVALSVAEKKESSGVYQFDAMAGFALKNLQQLKELCSFSGKKCSGELPYFVNVNGASSDAYKGVSFTSLCYRKYNDNVVSEVKDGRRFFTITGGGSIETQGDGNSDFAAAENGFISVSLVYPGGGCARQPESCAADFIL